MKYEFKEENLIKSDKHNTITILISFIFEYENLNCIGLNQKKAFYASQILAECLSKVSEKYKTEKDMATIKYKLYSSVVSFFIDDYYKNGCLNLVIGSINPKYVEDKDLLASLFSLAKEKLYHPLLNNKRDGFDSEKVNLKKKTLINDRKSIITNKAKYAKVRLLEEMKKEGEDELTFGYDTKEIEEINEYDIYKLYLHILSNSKVLVNAYGNIEYDNLKAQIDGLNLQTNDIRICAYEKNDYKVEKENKVVETQDITQAKLYLGYRTNITYDSTYFCAMVVFTVMFGGMVGSTLFRNIREKRSLVYNIYSTFNAGRKIFIIASANDTDKSDFIIEEVKNELSKYQSGNVDDIEEILELAKEEIINNEYSTYDSPNTILSEKITYYMTGLYEVDEFIEKVKEVSVDDIIYASKSLTLDTIYVLCGEKGNVK